MRLTFTPALLLLTLMTVNTVSAHGIWLENRRRNIEVIHSDGPEDDAYKTSEFHGAWGFDKNGKPVALQVQHLDTHVRLLPQGTPAVIVSSLDNAYYVEQTDKTWVNKGRTEVPDALTSLRVWRYNLAVLQQGAAIPRDLHHIKLVILPETDPTVLKAGEILPVQVLLDGKPLAGVKLTEDYRNMDHQASFTTDSQGRARVVVRNRGLNVIAVNHRQKREGDPDAAHTSMRSTLSFVASR